MAVNADLVNVLSWKNPLVSSAYLVAFNICLWILHRQRPVCSVAIVLLVCYLRKLWKQRIRSEVLLDPPDHEDWVTLSTYDLEKSSVDLGKRFLKLWVDLRNDHYLMWLTLTSVFWIILAKIASYVSFPTMLVAISNGGFLIGLLRKHNCFFEIQQCQNFDLAERILTTSLADAAEDLTPDCPTLSPLSQKEIELSSQATDTGPTASVSNQNQSDLLSEESCVSTTVSEPPAEPESLTPHGVAIPSHEDSSEDEFMFDPKHFESSSSSASNSFELLHF